MAVRLLGEQPAAQTTRAGVRTRRAQHRARYLWCRSGGTSGDDSAIEAWRKTIHTVLKKVDVDDLGDMDAQTLLESIPEEDDAGRGRQDLHKIEKDLIVKVVFCAAPGRHVLLVGAKAKLAKKCFVLRNLLSHYHWRLSGRDVAFEAMTAAK